MDQCLDVIARSPLPGTDKRLLRDELGQLSERIDQLSPIANLPGFKAIFPLNNVHAQIFAVQGKIW